MVELEGHLILREPQSVPSLLDPSLDITDVVGELELEELRVSMVTASASIAASQARLAVAMAAFNTRGGYAEGSGYSSFGQWASVDLGLSSRAATTLAAAGAAVAVMPTVRTAWLAGELTSNKVTTIVAVAGTESEEKWCAMALEASATQLSRIASAYRRGAKPDEDEPSGTERDDRCGVSWRTREDGLIELLAVLEPEDAAVVRAALESTVEMNWRVGNESTDNRRTGAGTECATPAVDATSHHHHHHDGPSDKEPSDGDAAEQPPSAPRPSEPGWARRS